MPDAPDHGTTAPRGPFGLPRDYWVVWTAVLVLWTGRFVVPFLSVYLSTARGMDAATTGVVTACYGVGGVLANLVGGFMADRFGRVPVVVTGQLGSAVLLVVLAQGTTPVALGVTLFCYGAVGQVAGPALSSCIAETVAPAQRERAYGLYVWAVNCGFAIGPVIATAVARWSFTAVFHLEAAVLTVVGLVLARALPRVGPTRDAHDAPGVRHAYGTVLHDRVFIVFTAAMLLFMTVYCQGTTTLSVALTTDGFSVSQFGALLTLNGVLLCLLQVPAVSVVERVPTSWVLATAVSVTAVGYLVQAFATSYWHYVLAVTLWTLGELGIFPVATTVVADLAPDRLRGLYQGLYGLVWSGGQSLAPLVGGAVLARAGGRPLWLGCVAVLGCVVVLLLTTRGPREVRARAARAVPPARPTADATA